MKPIKKVQLFFLLMLILLLSFTGCSPQKADDITTETTGTVETTDIPTDESDTSGDLEPSTEETLSVTGIYQGQIDNNSIEVKVGESYMAFRSTNFETLLVGIETGDNVEIKYLSNSEGQNELIEITKK